MRRFVHAIVVALLTFSISGAYALTIVEPCTGFEEVASDDGGCPPTCVTCGCCAQAVEPAHLHVAAVLELPNTPVFGTPPRLTDTQPRDILHVPKVRVL